MGIIATLSTMIQTPFEIVREQLLNLISVIGDDKCADRRKAARSMGKALRAAKEDFSVSQGAKTPQWKPNP